MRVGSLAYDAIGHEHNLAVQTTERLEFTAVCDVDPERLAAAREFAPEIAAFARAEEMLDSGLVDVVVVSTLPHTHHHEAMEALAPPLWFRVMDPRVAEHFDGDLSRAHVQPRRRRKLRLDDPVAEARMARIASTSAARAASGVHACPGCGYHYDEGAGDAREGFLPGTAWSRIPVDWCCPDCGVRTKEDFIAVAN